MGAFNEDNFDDDVDYYNEDIEDDAKAVGDLWIGVALQMPVQNLALDMINMVGRFQSLVHFIIQSLAY